MYKIEVMNLFLSFYLLIITICHFVASKASNLLDSQIKGEFEVSKFIKDGNTGSSSIEDQSKGSHFEDDIHQGSRSNEDFNNRPKQEGNDLSELGSKEGTNIIAQSSIELKPTIFHWEKGVVPYFVDPGSYDEIIVKRIRTAMNSLERVSCVIFKPMAVNAPEFSKSLWLSIENPTKIRRCIHRVLHGDTGKATMIIGYDCMTPRDILHSLLHVLGFHDEITHPQRDNYVRIVWPNIQPQYRSLFWIRADTRTKDMVEYDTMSIMHFHDHAYTNNGGPTIVPLLPGLNIKASETCQFSQLDVMKLQLIFGRDCNKRKVRKLYETCEAVLAGDNNNKNDKGKNQDDADIQSGMNEQDDQDDYKIYTENPIVPLVTSPKT